MPGLPAARRAPLFPTLCSVVTSCWQLEIGLGGNIYTTEICKRNEFGLFFSGVSWLINIYPHTTEYWGKGAASGYVGCEALTGHFFKMTEA